MGLHTKQLMRVEKDVKHIFTLCEKYNYPEPIIEIVRAVDVKLIEVAPRLSDLEERTGLLVSRVAKMDSLNVSSEAGGIVEYLRVLMDIVWQMCYIEGHANPMAKLFEDFFNTLDIIANELELFSKELKWRF